MRLVAKVISVEVSDVSQLLGLVFVVINGVLIKVMFDGI